MENEQIEIIIEKRKRLTQSQLQTRQHGLKSWLEDNFVSGKYFSIEEICEAGIGYTLNTDPKTHDKCIALSNDVRELNWHTGRERYIPIIKNKKGGIKLAENKQELKEFVEKEKARIETKYQYYNHLTSLMELEGSIPFINQANRVLDEDEMKPLEVYAK